MIDSPTDTPYTDEILAQYIEQYPVIDDAGKESGDADWTPTYDINAAAADIWEEKAAAVQKYYDFNADGGSYSQSQLHETAMDKVRYHRARQRAVVKQVFKAPSENVDTASEELTYDEAYAWWRAN
jgi:hypothetical protein